MTERPSDPPLTRPPASSPADAVALGEVDAQTVGQLIEEYENEATARKLGGIWLWLTVVLAAAVSIYALFWTQYSINTQVYRATFLGLVLVLSLLLYPVGPRRWGVWLAGGVGVVASLAAIWYVVTAFPRTDTGTLALGVALLAVQAVAFGLYPFLRPPPARVALYDILLALLAIASLGYLVQNYAAALQRIVNPTSLEVVMGLVLIIITLEATRRTTGVALTLTVALFLVYAVLGPYVPEPFDHRGYRVDRIVGQNYLTLEGIFGVPLDVAATFIVLFTIYGAVLEYSGAGRFFLDWSFAALGRSQSGAGPGRTVTAAGFLLGTVSGSGVATTVTLGALSWPMLRKAGYPRDVSGGMLAAAGIGATLSPPTLGAAAFLIAEYLQIDYLQVLIFAVIPTILYYLSALLMIEADSRRLKTQAVAVQADSLWSLTVRYGYHFTSLFAVAVLMAVGMTPFMAVFWSIVIAFALSFIRAETRLTSLTGLAVGALVTAALLVTGVTPLERASTAFFWGMMTSAVVALGAWLYGQARGTTPNPIAPLLRALESGGRGVVPIAATTAAAGLIVSVVTLTGLGLKISGQIVDLAGGSVLLTVVLAAVAVWVLGLAVPVTASYIIAAVMIVPALVRVGVPEPAAHMFIFYYAVLADVTPPTALAPSAAAALTGGRPYPTMMLAWKYCLPGFLVPIMFTLTPEGSALLMIGPPAAILWTFLTSCIAVAMFAGALGGWIWRPANPIERVLLAIGGLALMYADLRTDLLGFVVLAGVLALHLVRVRRTVPAGV
jgi:TRAP transporter 4TM/12TM fusion protein